MTAVSVAVLVAFSLWVFYEWAAYRGFKQGRRR